MKLDFHCARSAVNPLVAMRPRRSRQRLGHGAVTLKGYVSGTFLDGDIDVHGNSQVYPYYDQTDLLHGGSGLPLESWGSSDLRQIRHDRNSFRSCLAVYPLAMQFTIRPRDCDQRMVWISTVGGYFLVLCGGASEAGAWTRTVSACRVLRTDSQGPEGIHFYCR